MSEDSIGTCLPNYKSSYPRNHYPPFFFCVWATSKSDDYDNLYTKTM